jgi:hypothetical protein
MPMVRTAGDGSDGSTIGSSSVLGSCQYALCGFTHMAVRTTASFFCIKPYPQVIGMLSDKASQGASRAGLQPSGKESLSGDFAP